MVRSPDAQKVIQRNDLDAAIYCPVTTTLILLSQVERHYFGSAFLFLPLIIHIDRSSHCEKNLHFVHSVLIICLYLSMSNKQKQEIMKAINPILISDNNTFKFKTFKSGLVDQIDVFHKGNRVAILNGIDGAALRWVVGSDKISLKAVDQLEKMVQRLVNQTIKIHLKNK